MSLERITKNKYFDLIENNTHYHCGVWFNVGEHINFEDIQGVLAQPNAEEVVLNSCPRYEGATQNSNWFMHIKADEEVIYEEKRGTFYKELLNGILFIYHCTDDAVVTVKAVL